MQGLALKNVRQLRRRRSVRRKLRGSGRPRLSVFRSCQHTYAQIIDDGAGKTVCGVGTSAKQFASDLAGKSKTERAEFIGREVARLALEKGIDTVVLDRGPYKFHGRVKALAEAAREAGLKF